MLISRSVLLTAFIGSSVLTGCAPKVESVAVKTSSPVDEIKKGLEEIAATGQIGSSIEDIRMNSGKLEDPAKVTALQAGLDELAVMTDPAKIKAKAQALISAL